MCVYVCVCVCVWGCGGGGGGGEGPPGPPCIRHCLNCTLIGGSTNIGCEILGGGGGGGPALLNEVVPRCLRSSLERLPPASLRC